MALVKCLLCTGHSVLTPSVLSPLWQMLDSPPFYGSENWVPKQRHEGLQLQFPCDRQLCSAASQTVLIYSSSPHNRLSYIRRASARPFQT